MAIMSAFQAEDGGSIPLARSIQDIHLCLKLSSLPAHVVQVKQP